MLDTFHHISHLIQTISLIIRSLWWILVVPVIVMSYTHICCQFRLYFLLMCAKWLSFCYLSLHASFLGCLELVLCSYHPRYFGWISPFIDASCFLSVISTLYVKHNGWKLSALHVSALHCSNNYFFEFLCMVYYLKHSDPVLLPLAWMWWPFHCNFGPAGKTESIKVKFGPY